MNKWTDRAKGLTLSIPGLQQLVQQAINPSLKQGLASIGYRFKNGEHTWLSAPCFSPDDLATTARYLHACRVEALSGQQCAGWLNAPAMSNRTDLLIWTRASGQYCLLSADATLAVEWIRTDPRTGHLKQPPVNSGCAKKKPTLLSCARHSVPKSILLPCSLILHPSACAAIPVSCWIILSHIFQTARL